MKPTEEEARNRRAAEHEWHGAINRFSQARAADAEWPRWMYEAGDR